jgi:hypothetical protein
MSTAFTDRLEASLVDSSEEAAQIVLGAPIARERSARVPA